MEMFGRKNADPVGSRESVQVQVDFGNRTCATNTEDGLMRTVGCATDDVFLVDREIAMDALPCWDAAIQHGPFLMDASCDPGEWNSSIVHGVDVQTDTQVLQDPLFWFTGSISQINTVISGLLNLLEECHLGDSTNVGSSKDTRDTLQLRTDNTLLRIEVAELKRKLCTANISTFSTKSDTWTPIRAPRLAGLTGGYSVSDTFEVVDTGPDKFLSVTSSLAPSSFSIGRLKLGDKVLAAGRPEEILGLIRSPILPRGWTTIRDKQIVYLSKTN